MTAQVMPIAPLRGDQVLVLMLTIALLLALAVGLGRLAVRFGMPAVAGELCAGLLLGPSVIGHLAPDLAAWLLFQPEQLHLVDAIGQLGVLLLVGLVGTGVDVGLLRRRRTATLAVGLGGLLVPLGMGIAVGFVLPAALVGGGTDRVVFAAFLGVAMCVSAIPVIAKVLLEMRLLHRDIGQLIMNVAMIDDLVGWLLLSVVSAMATVGVRVGSVVMTVAGLILLVVAALTVARPVVGGVLRLAGRSAEPGTTVAAVVVLLAGFAAAAQVLGTEPVLGALLGGLVIGSSRSFDRARLVPLRVFVMAVLAPVYFASAGLRMDLTALGTPSVLMAGLATLSVAVVGKFAGAYLGARMARLGHWNALALGAGLNARGVIEVIIAMVGLQLGVLTTAMYTIIVLVAVATSLMAPPMLRFAARRIASTPQEDCREQWMAHLAGASSGSAGVAARTP